jgi:hypothetical protein
MTETIEVGGVISSPIDVRLSIAVTCSKSFNQLTPRTSSGQTGLSSEGGPAIAHPTPLHGVCWESGF